MDEQLRKLIEGAKAQGATNEDIKRIIDMYVADSKKKRVSEPIAAQKPLASSTQPTKPATSLATEEPEQAQASDGLGGPAKNPFGQEQKPVELGGFAVNQQPVQAKPEQRVSLDEKMNRFLKSNTSKTPIETTEEEKPNMEGLWPVRKSDKDHYHPEEGVLKKAGKYALGTLASAAMSANEWGESLVKSAAADMRYAGLDESKAPKLNKVVDKNGKPQYTIELNALHPENKAGWFGTIMNSVLSPDQKKSVITSLDNKAKQIQNYNDMLQMYQKDVQGDNIPTKIVNGIVGFVPDLLVAAAVDNPELATAKAAKWTEAATAKALPLIEKYAPKALGIAEKYLPKASKIVAEGANSSLTKVIAAKEGLREMGESKKGENPYMNLVEGSVKGGMEGLYMHGLGAAAGGVAKPLSKVISKSGINSAIAMAISTPLANAGVFTAARTIRKGIEEGKLITPEEAATEAGTGVGFSLLHLGTQYNDHEKLNNYYDNVLQNDTAGSLGRVLNETKENLDIAHNPKLNEEGVKELESARDELRNAILKEPDLSKKEILGNEALTIQNQLDTYSAVNGIIKNKDAVIDSINSNEHLTEEQKSFYTKKAEAIADTYDNSEYGLKKKELSAKVDEAQKQLDDAATKFSNVTKPSDRAIAKAKVDNRRKELEDLNGQLVDLVSTKPVKEAPVAKEEVKPIEENKPIEEVKLDYKLPKDSDVNTMTVVENDGKFLIGDYTEKTETSNPVLKPVSDLENNPLSFDSKEEAQAKLDEIKNPIEEIAKPTEEKVVPLHETLAGLEGLGSITKLRGINENMNRIIKELKLETKNC